MEIAQTCVGCGKHIGKRRHKAQVWIPAAYAQTPSYCHQTVRCLLEAGRRGYIESFALNYESAGAFIIYCHSLYENGRRLPFPIRKDEEEQE